MENKTTLDVLCNYNYCKTQHLFSHNDDSQRYLLHMRTLIINDERTKIIEFINAGFNVKKILYDDYANPLQFAFSYSSLDMIKFLIDNGFDILENHFATTPGLFYYIFYALNSCTYNYDNAFEKFVFLIQEYNLNPTYFLYHYSDTFLPNKNSAIIFEKCKQYWIECKNMPYVKIDNN